MQPVQQYVLLEYTLDVTRLFVGGIMVGTIGVMGELEQIAKL
ncbi:unnamed protein product [marine sediment metagenome]|uniref:Uncharacterized protein n=1 Tax=marine sediment metagenome TaxID=412755 RepID=X0Y012_9ZZZZ